MLRLVMHYTGFHEWFTKRANSEGCSTPEGICVWTRKYTFTTWHCMTNRQVRDVRENTQFVRVTRWNGLKLIVTPTNEVSDTEGTLELLWFAWYVLYTPCATRRWCTEVRATRGGAHGSCWGYVSFRNICNWKLHFQIKSTVVLLYSYMNNDC